MSGLPVNLCHEQMKIFVSRVSSFVELDNDREVILCSKCNKTYIIM